MKEHLMLRQIDDAALPSRRAALASIPRPPTNGERQPRHACRTGMDEWMDGGDRLAGDDAHASNDAPKQRLRAGSLAGVYARFTMALSSSSPWLCLSPSVSNDVLAFIPRSSAHLHQHQTRVLPRISCKADDTIGSKRRGRRGGRKDPMMDEREVMWPYLETQERMIVDLNKQILVDTENLLHRANNKFGLVLEIAEEANEYLRNNKDEALTKKPILKVMSDRINEAAGENIRDAYCEETLDPQE